MKFNHSWMKKSRQPERTQPMMANNDFYIREAYKSLRTNVMFSLTEETDCHVLMVTSSMPGEGKSTTSVNLAISFAQAGKRTLIIDCDMRKPALTRLLKMKSSLGLSNTLIDLSQLENAVVPLKWKNLYMMSAGSVPPNPSELLSSKRMRTLIAKLREEYEYIILDTPPVNVVTDGVILSTLTEGTLFVVRSGISERNAVKRAVGLLEHADAKLLGFVLNGVEMHDNAYGRSGQYGYGYGYANSHTEEADEYETTL